MIDIALPLATHPLPLEFLGVEGPEIILGLPLNELIFDLFSLSFSFSIK